MNDRVNSGAPPPALATRHISKWLGNKPILQDVSFSLAQGEILAFIGPSGAGKTTLLRCLNLLHLIDEGEIEAFGQPLITARRADGRQDLHLSATEHRKRVGMVFQTFNLWPEMTVWKNVIAAPLHAARLPENSVYAEAESLLDRFGLKDFASVPAGRLSVGQQQRVALARALAIKPTILLLDEVTSALDVCLVAEVLDLLHSLVHTGLTMVLISHHLQFVEQAADRVAMMDAGTIVEIGPTAEVLTRPSQKATQRFIERVHQAH
jgi:polar amino acid transport system ATP-binding protein